MKRSTLRAGAALIDDVVRWRREIHRRPELGYQEVRTSALVERELVRAGLEPRRIARTGIVATLTGARRGTCIALRADMDALPVMEASGEAFSSEVAGAMHACGHDAHTAMLLGAAVSLAAERERLAGTIKFFFQPAEEGPGGALPMIEAGVMEDPRVDAVAMLHVTPLLPVGSIGLHRGPAQASCDDFDITIAGRGGHGGHPHKAVDTIPIASEIVLALQRIVSREIDPLQPVVISIGTINGGFRRNVVAETTSIGGTIRCLDDGVRATMPERMERIVKGVCEAHRASYSLNIERGYPPVFNDPVLADHVAAVAEGVTEITTVIDLDRPTMGAEDFAYFAQKAPGCVIRLGVGFDGVADPPMLHSPAFRLDERALPVGVALLRALGSTLPQRLLR